MIGKIGSGKIVRKGEYTGFSGEVPFEDGEEVAVVRRDDLNTLMLNALDLLFRDPNNRLEFFGRDRMPVSPFPLPDDILTEPKGEEPNTLYLDRRIYTPNPRRIVLVRYTSVDYSLEEERPFE
jgi:hypothetical protein